MPGPVETEVVNQGGPIVGALYVLALAVLSSAGFWAWMTKKQDKGLNEAKEGEAVVNAATAVVEMQQLMMDQLKVELDKQAEQIRTEAAEEMERERKSLETEMSSMKGQLEDMARANQSLRNDLVEWKKRCEHLEQVNQEQADRNKELMIRLEVMNNLKCDSDKS